MVFALALVDNLRSERDALLARNEELRSANGYAELEARLAEAEALLHEAGKEIWRLCDHHWMLPRIDAFLAADSASPREGEA